MVRRVIAGALVAAAVAWGTAILAAPMVHGRTQEEVPRRIAALTYLVGALVCHQKPERSFHLAGAQLPVCARCAALYWGGAIGLAGFLLGRGARGASSESMNRTLFARAIFILAVPIALTLGASAIGVWDSSNLFRAVSSAPFGAALGVLLAAVVLGDLR